jgi:hypothetical protein
MVCIFIEELAMGVIDPSMQMATCQMIRPGERKCASVSRYQCYPRLIHSMVASQMHVVSVKWQLETICMCWQHAIAIYPNGEVVKW